mmetsp:Transcript_12294/g.42657  ORF Transcript_12294/g.42657 Transcript_12294/m.42657 type:complete len:301 (+) Transcript_12294:3-905(+)
MAAALEAAMPALAAADEEHEEELRANTLRFGQLWRSKSKGKERPGGEEDAMSAEDKDLLHQLQATIDKYANQKRKLARQLERKAVEVRTALGEIRRYTSPPGVLANVIVGLMLVLGEPEVRDAMFEAEPWLRGRRGSVDDGADAPPAEVVVGEDAWNAARRHIQLGKTHPQYILRRMSEASKRTTVDLPSVVEERKHMTRMELAEKAMLSAVLKGLQREQVAHASSVVVVVYEWVMACIMQKRAVDRAAEEVQANLAGNSGLLRQLKRYKEGHSSRKLSNVLEAVHGLVRGEKQRATKAE